MNQSLKFSDGQNENISNGVSNKKLYAHSSSFAKEAVFLPITLFSKTVLN